MLRFLWRNKCQSGVQFFKLRDCLCQSLQLQIAVWSPPPPVKTKYQRALADKLLEGDRISLGVG
jgi:hypothetical protein